MKISAQTPEEYLGQLPEDRRAVVSAVRDLILEHLPPGYVEAIRWGMLSYEIPLDRYPTTYNGQPLAYVGLAAQKKHFALYLMGAYTDAERYQALEEQFSTEGKKLQMGRSCLRFRSMDELSLKAIADAVGSVPVERMIEFYEASRTRP